MGESVKATMPDDDSAGKRERELMEERAGQATLNADRGVNRR
jgi:hypothetical protein